MDLFLSTFQLVCISLAAGSSFIFDSFFLLSLKDHKLKLYEKQALFRISLMTVTASIIALGTYITLLITHLDAPSDLEIGFSSAKIIILGIALLCALTLRRIHLPTLVRYQENYFHLSENMVYHQDSLAGTAAFSTVSWLTVIFLTSIEYKGLTMSDFSFLKIIVTYLTLAMITSHIFVFIKNRILTR